MEKQSDEAVIIAKDVEFRKKDIEELIDYLNKLENAYAQSELECNMFRKKYFDKTEENYELRAQIESMKTKND